ncbi:protein tweety-like [Galleria mellonella]|uniref:Protein tweety homolog n=1 Tax=Galleria mellonella TaxID=7137 RepID=A0A6J1WPZ1_GALME|nr:protein tweety-like [Galleria mellonella]XP_052750209.1 protein tweety-like [Galleria mellonella]XP_052750214.1 protein tweety-like [Galleria mellonella]XP_052750218.1 protein tweety-like [Galleria mellonella]XP_052750223.1 protein tweety-like [Galleria mellonella]
MGASGVSDEYTPPRLSRLLHSLPHINVTLHRVNDTFAPNSPVYLESLGILGSIPGAWLILTLTVLLIYLLTRCCDRKQRPPRSITALKITLMILSVLCCGAIGVGLFGNDDLHNAMLQSIQAGNQLAALVNTVKNQSSILEETMGSRARAPLARLADALDLPVANQTALGTLLRALSTLRNNASIAASAADNLRRPLAALNLDAFMKRMWVWEAARWAGGMAGWCCGGAVCVALLAAAARRSRRALLLLCVGALGALVACWLASAVLAAGAVAAADACQEPAAALAHHARHGLPADMVHYYLSCKVSRENVLTAELRVAQRAVVAVRQALAVLSRGAPQLFNDPGLQPALGALNAGTGEAERALVSLSAALECRTARASFVAGARAACDAGLQALTLQLLAAVAAGFLFTAIVLVDSHAWIYINTKRSGTGEEQAPFLSSGGSSAASRTLPRPAPFPNGKPPSYSAAVQLMDLGERERPRSRMSGSATLGRGAGGGGGGGGGGAALGGSHTLGRAPHNGKYATLSKQCKTLESNDFY